MASTNAVPSIHTISFRFDVTNVSALNYDGIWSPTVQIDNVPWRVNVYKIGHGEDEDLGALLKCEKDDGNSELSNWSYVVDCRFKLLASSLEQHAFEENYSRAVFDKENRNLSDSLIKWRDLFDATKQYVENDKITLETTVEMANANDVLKSELKLENIDKCCEKGGLGTFRLTVHNIKELIALRSPCIVLRNIRWFFTVLKCYDHLGIHLDASDTSDEFSCDVEMVIKLIPSNSGFEPVEARITEEMKKWETLWISELILWNQLLAAQYGFINENSIVIEVKLTVSTAEEAASNSRKRATPGPSNEAKHRKLECAICSEEFKKQEISITNCGHLFCSACIRDEITYSKECPTCRTSATLRQLKRAHLPFVN